MEKRTADILLVEDNPADTELVLDLLAQEEQSPFCPYTYRVATANRISKALELIDGAQHPGQPGIDCVLLDLLLPDSRGIETYTKLQAALPEVPVVILSGLDYDVVGAQALKTGAADYLDKSRALNANLLGHTIQFAMERQRTKQQKTDSDAQKIVEESFKNLIKHSSDPMVVLRDTGHIMAANMAYLSLVGKSPKNVAEELFEYELHPGQTSSVKVTDRSNEVGWWNLRMDIILWHGQRALLAHFMAQDEADE